MQFIVDEPDYVGRVLPEMDPHGLLEGKSAVRYAEEDQSGRKHFVKDPGQETMAPLDGGLQVGFNIIKASIFNLLPGKLRFVVTFHDGFLPAQLVVGKIHGLDR